MQNIIIDNISLILLLPLWLFLIIMGGRFFSVYVNKGIIYILTLLSSLWGTVFCAYSLTKYTEPLEITYPFIKINDFIIDFGLRVDKLSLIMGIVLFAVSFCVQLYSVSYMRDEKKNYRFFGFLNLFNFSMASLLFSPNLFQMYVFWELVGVISYLLIGFDYKKQDKSIASKRVFLINRIGDTALISGIILTSYYMYNYAGNLSFVTLSFEDFNAISTLLSAYVSPLFFAAICLLFIIGAMVKSAQIPFYTWLQDAMRAKLPVSALLHSATMVALGVYLISRMMPFFTLNSMLLKIILWIGLTTAVVCSVLACIEIKPKKVLAYSTSANLGLMFMALGLSNIKIAILLFISHAFIKSALFLGLSDRNYKMSNKTWLIFAVASFSLVFLMPAKEMLYTTFGHKTLFMGILFLSSIYIFRLIFTSKKEKQSGYSLEQFSALLLLCMNFCLYIVLAANTNISLKLFAVSALGLFVVLILKKLNILTKLSRTPKFAEYFNNCFVPRVYYGFSSLNNCLEQKVLSNYKPILSISQSFVKLTGWVEEKIMNNSVKLVVQASKSLSNAFMKLQSGNVQTYNAYALIIVTTIMAFMIIGYLLIIDKMIG